jgi:CRP-like cAMP-binding protein
VIRRLGPGEWFGELALLQESRRSATVRALVDTSVLAIPRHEFATLVEHFPALQAALKASYR